MFGVIAGERSVSVVGGYARDEVPVPGSGNVFVFAPRHVGVLRSGAEVESLGLNNSQDRCFPGHSVGHTFWEFTHSVLRVRLENIFKVET